MLCNSARAVVAMADRKMVFPWIGVESKVRGSDQPVRAILLQVAVSALLMGFPFDVLVVVDTFFKNVALGLESMAFLALRHNEPGAERPFQVPGGLAGAWAITIPKFAILLFTMANVGLPGTSGFIGEILTMVGGFQASTWAAAGAALGVIFSAVYMLTLYRRTVFGQITNPELNGIKDMNLIELICIVPLALLTILFGIAPNLIFNITEGSALRVLNLMAGG